MRNMPPPKCEICQGVHNTGNHDRVARYQQGSQRNYMGNSQGPVAGNYRGYTQGQGTSRAIEYNANYRSPAPENRPVPAKMEQPLIPTPTVNYQSQQQAPRAESQGPDAYLAGYENVNSSQVYGPELMGQEPGNLQGSL